MCFVSAGWQPRWFVLEDGVISYYDSEDDVAKGSKGSIKMSVCDIKGWSTWPGLVTVKVKVSNHTLCFSPSHRLDSPGADHSW